MIPKFKIARGVPLSFSSTYDRKIQYRKGCSPKFFVQQMIPNLEIARGAPLSFSSTYDPKIQHRKGCPLRFGNVGWGAGGAADVGGEVNYRRMLRSNVTMYVCMSLEGLL